jgi:signal peptidase I
MNPWFLLVPVPAVALACAIMTARRRYVVVRVNGASMVPALRPGDRVLVRRGHGGQLRAGAVAVLRAPPAGCGAGPELPPGSRNRVSESWVIKRVAAAHGDAVPESVRAAVGGIAIVPPGMLVVLGDNARSTDSRLWGFLSADHVLGAVIRRLPPPGGNN